MIRTQYNRVTELMKNHRPHMDAIVKVLLEKETLDAAEFDAILADVNRQLGIVEETNKDDDDELTPPPEMALDGGAVIQTKTDEKDDKDRPPQGGWSPSFA
jgi:hypothetical protein